MSADFKEGAGSLYGNNPEEGLTGWNPREGWSLGVEGNSRNKYTHTHTGVDYSCRRRLNYFVCFFVLFCLELKDIN